MKLLLLLSALLSALTGVDAGVRRDGPAAAVAERLVTATRVAQVALAPLRPDHAPPSRATLARVRVELTSAPHPGAPLFQQRRRE